MTSGGINQGISTRPVMADYAPIHNKGYCVWYDQCIEQEGKALNCLYNGPAKTMNDSKGIELLNKMCPKFAADRKTCCSTKQLAALDSNLNTLRQFASRCPACLQNLVDMFCELTCSPDQSLFMDPTAVLPIPFGKQSIMRISCFVPAQFKKGLFNSCKDVVFPEDNEKILNLLCGQSAETCTPHKLLEYMGSTANGRSPFDVIFPEIIPQHLSWMNAETFKCNESYVNPWTNKTNWKCSCQDCAPSCPVPPPPSPILPLECSMIIFIIVNISLFALFVVVFCCKKFVKGCSTRIHDFGGLRWIFTKWGHWCSLHPFIVIISCVVFVGILAGGLKFYKVTKDPVELWSAPDSTARKQKDLFDSKFTPFYRTEQLIITVNPDYPQNHTGYHQHPDGKFIPFGNIFHLDLLNQALELQQTLTNLPASFTENGKTINITLGDVCYKPLAPYNSKCVIQSLFQYFQNNRSKLNLCLNDILHHCYPGMPFNFQADFHDHVRYCTSAPSSLSDEKWGGGPCLGENGIPVNPNIILGGFNGTNYNMANAMIITFAVSNHKDESQNARAEAWEKAFIAYMKQYVKDPQNKNLTISYSSERSIQDELDRESETDILTILVSYTIMFVYITIALAQVNSCGRIMVCSVDVHEHVDSKFTLAFCSIIIVLCSVVCSIGFWSYVGEPANLITIAVVPFLVLAVGVDNFFFLVQAYKRLNRYSYDDIPNKIGQALGEVAPIILLSSFAEFVAFAFGAMSSMPAVKVFSLYAAVAVFINFIFQITWFVAVMSLDAKRHESNRMDVVSCITTKDSKVEHHEGCISWIISYIIKNIYAPILLSSYVRPFVLVLFGALVFASGWCSTRMSVGLDKELILSR
ncbi:hypothetical protein QZH41_020257, partial [Actinostola sp. cb2023]